MGVVLKNTQVSFRSNADLVSKAKEIFKSNNIDMSLALNQFLLRTVEENNLPFAVYDEQAEKVYEDLKSEMDKAYLNYQKGNVIPASEVEKKWGIK